MPPRAVRRLAAVALLAVLGLGAGCFVLGLDAESTTAARMADGALVLVLLIIGTPLTFLIWPWGA